MKEYLKPELELVIFASESITDQSSITGVVGGEDDGDL